MKIYEYIRTHTLVCVLIIAVVIVLASYSLSFVHCDISHKFIAQQYGGETVEGQLCNIGNIYVEISGVIRGNILTKTFYGTIQVGDTQLNDLKLNLEKKTPSLYFYKGSEKVIYGFMITDDWTLNRCIIVVQKNDTSDRKIILCNMSITEAQTLGDEIFVLN